MKEIPLLFSTLMVQALLDKRKTQTRRIMKQQIKDCDHSRYKDAEWKDQPTQWSEAALKIGRAYCSLCGNGTEYSNDFGGIKCPYGVPGDLLYVRENWFPAAINGNKVMVGYYDKDPGNTVEFETNRAGFYNRQLVKGRMIPSIHMPKEAARIWLRKTATKVERVCDISEEDAIAEGVERNRDGSWHDYLEPNRLWQDTAKASFQSLWIKINGAETWNNWVWVNTFDVLSTTGKPELITENVIL